MRRVFVAGFTQAAESWTPVAERLGDRESVLASVAADRDFVATAHALDRGVADYVGYSMGGRLCLQLALDLPANVRRLALVSASPGIEDPEERAARLEADSQLARQIERDGVEAFLEHWLTQPLFATLPRELARIEERAQSATVGSLVHQVRTLGQGTQPSNWWRLESLRMPVLIIAGERDEKYVDVGRRMAAAIPDARFEIIPGAGHACHLEQPDAVAHLLSTW